MKQPKSIQIAIPQPCSEDWNNMTPKEQGKFCNSCQKCVVDFTMSSDDEIYRYFIEHKTAHTCGRFLPGQLNKNIGIPQQPHSELYKWMMAAGLTLLFTVSSADSSFAQAPLKTEHVCDSTHSNCGQSYGYLYGSIVDASWRKPQTNVRVILTKGDTVVMETLTNEYGVYQFNEASEGMFTLTTEAEGYRKGMMVNVPIVNNQPLNINLRLKKVTASTAETPDVANYNILYGPPKLLPGKDTPLMGAALHRHN